MFDPDEQVPYSKIPYSVVESPEHIAKALDMAVSTDDRIADVLSTKGSL